jgi:cysteinyl-tRNA synthetase
VRFLLLNTHYRSPIEYSDDRLAEMGRALEGFYRFFERFQRITGTSFYDVQAPRTKTPFEPTGRNREFLDEVKRLRSTFLEHMDDDFNTGGAVGELHDLLNTLNRFADARQLEGAQKSPDAVADFREGAVVLKELGQILGLFERPPARQESGDDELVNGLMRLLIDLRAEARKSKNYALADQIRKRLGELKITIEDRPGGTGWRRG